jgi:hypothetical protein
MAIIASEARGGSSMTRKPYSAGQGLLTARAVNITTMARITIINTGAGILSKFHLPPVRDRDFN